MNNNKMERFNGEVGDREKTMRRLKRNKVMRGLDDEETAQTMMDGLRVYYNFLRPHTALKGRTPAQKANIETHKAEWMSLIKKASQHQKFETSS
jgi:transposase InsO family protein